MPRTHVLAAFTALCLAAPPAHAATDSEKFQKKVGRFALRDNENGFAKPRGLCVCQSDDAEVHNRVGFLIYGEDVGVVVTFVKVACAVPTFDSQNGSWGGDIDCGSWTLLSR